MLQDLPLPPDDLAVSSDQPISSAHLSAELETLFLLKYDYKSDAAGRRDVITAAVDGYQGGDVAALLKQLLLYLRTEADVHKSVSDVMLAIKFEPNDAFSGQFIMSEIRFCLFLPTRDVIFRPVVP